MEARRERILEMARMLLPCVEDCHRKERRTKNVLLSTCILFAFLGGYLVHENTRTINTNEYVILKNIIHMSAEENKHSSQFLTDEVTRLYQVDSLQDLRARDWNDALHYLAYRRSN
jgi:hypothetical protein